MDTVGKTHAEKIEIVQALMIITNVFEMYSDIDAQTSKQMENMATKLIKELDGWECSAGDVVESIFNKYGNM